MRSATLAVLIGACGGAVTPVAPPPPIHHVVEAAPVDPLTALDPAADAIGSWLVPGRMWLDPGSSPVDATTDAAMGPIEVFVFDEHADRVRIAVRGDAASFAVWVTRASLLPVIARDTRVGAMPGAAPFGEIGATLRAGVRVQRLGVRGSSTRVRYLGAVEIEGWVPTDALVDRGNQRVASPSMGSLTVLPGAVIRAEAQWASPAVALVSLGTTLEPVGPVERWTEVTYDDGEVVVRGFVAPQDPPGLLHGWELRAREEVVPPPTTAAMQHLPVDACLYAGVGGEPIGRVTRASDYLVEPDRGGWGRAYVPTAWGTIVFGVLRDPDVFGACPH
ncbi:MAG TPA: hypothetical protein VGM88_20200 [Kofleriaceae bacterium]|jgi:hypothetical protein